MICWHTLAFDVLLYQATKMNITYTCTLNYSSFSMTEIDEVLYVHMAGYAQSKVS